MRKYDDDIKKELVEIVCNKCSKKIIIENGIAMNGVMNISYGWGYFSRKDGETHNFDLCEECYDSFINEFQIPVTIEERNEIV